MDEKLDDVGRRRLLSSAVDAEAFKPAASLVRADFAARSHSGRAARGNDDHYLVLRLSRRMEALSTSLIGLDVPDRFEEYAYAAVVADGIGRNGAGAVAARLAISTLAHLELRFGQWTMRIDPQVAAELMDRSRWFYQRTHDAVSQWYRAHLEIGEIAATMTGMYTAGNNLFVAHVGHSRCYLFRKGLLTLLTRDQTLQARLATSTELIPVGRVEDAQHILMQSIGSSADQPAVMVEHFRLEDDDSLLLCTNGLTDMVADDRIAETLASRRTPQEQCDLLLDAALINGGRDDVTVILANYHIPDLKEE
jgi:PPM family protein phosphatase